MRAARAHVLPRLCDLAELADALVVHLRRVRLHRRCGAVLELLHALLVDEARLLVPRLQRLLHNLQTLVLQSLDLCFAPRHFLHLLHLHHLLPCLRIVLDVWQRRLECTPLPSPFNHLNFCNTGRKSASPHKFTELQQLRLLRRAISDAGNVGSERICLNFGLSVVGLSGHSLGDRLGLLCKVLNRVLRSNGGSIDGQQHLWRDCPQSWDGRSLEIFEAIGTAHCPQLQHNSTGCCLATSSEP
mmetsp:Transcript_24768/g.58849  ORF Transcript_24768/g.58849 Transcript_24768/m.58849 type:complete len:243 (+) Transcript_24768:1340-2068(+)